MAGSEYICLFMYVPARLHAYLLVSYKLPSTNNFSLIFDDQSAINTNDLKVTMNMSTCMY